MKKQLNLGQLIFLLERIDPKLTIRFAFGGFIPTSIDSYRGYYEQLAIGYAEPGGERKECTVEELLKLCRDKVGATVSGYKGGDYDVGERTWMWAANWGECHSCAIVDVIETGWCAIIETGWQE